MRLLFIFVTLLSHLSSWPSVAIKPNCTTMEKERDKRGVTLHSCKGCLFQILHGCEWLANRIRMILNSWLNTLKSNFDQVTSKIKNWFNPINWLLLLLSIFRKFNRKINWGNPSCINWYWGVGLCYVWYAYYRRGLFDV